ILFLTSLVYLYQALRYRHVYNLIAEKGHDVKHLKTFKWGWLVCISVYHGILMAYVGLLVFWADISRSGEVGSWSVLKAVVVTAFGLYILNIGLTWVNLRLKK